MTLAGLMSKEARATDRSVKIRVWDPLLRAFHWLVAIGCFIDLFLLDDGRSWHRAIGYAVAAALLVRLLWGFVGTKYARFKTFIPTPFGLLSYVRALARRTEPRFIGHNPAGAVMILLLMALLAGISLTGWMLTLDAYFGEEWLEDLHGALANVLLIFVLVHVVAALYESLRHSENLVWSMITGYKRL
jgi:cytochrome b